MAKNNGRIPSVLFQFKMPKETADQVDLWIEEGYFASREEFFNSASLLMKWAIEVKERGDDVASYTDETLVVTTIEFNSKITKRPTVKSQSSKARPQFALAIDNTK